MNNYKTLLILMLMGMIYGGVFYPFYTEFLEFGQSLAGHIKIYDFDGQNRDEAPTILYIIAKFIVKKPY